MQRYVHLATKNNCYKDGKLMTKPAGILIHSTGAVNKCLKRYVDYPDVCGKNIYGNHWDQPKPDGKNKCVHAFIGEDKDGNAAVVEILPLNFICWGCAGSYNYNPTAHIQFEICEGPDSDSTYFAKAYNCAVEYCAWLCKQFNLSPDTITSHKEAADKGCAGKHTDPFGYFAKFGKNMNMFREAVKAQLTSTAAPKTTACKTVYKSLGVAARRVAMSLTADVKSRCKIGGHYPIIATVALPDGTVWLKHSDGTYSALKDTDSSALFSSIGVFVEGKTNANCVVRSSPSIASRRLDKLPPGAAVILMPGADTKTDGLTWTRIIYNGAVAWVDKQWAK